MWANFCWALKRIPQLAELYTKVVSEAVEGKGRPSLKGLLSLIHLNRMKDATLTKRTRTEETSRANRVN